MKSSNPLFLYGAPRRIRTSDIQIRSLTLYPAEPWARFFTSIFTARRGGKVPFPEVRPLCPHPTFRAMGGHCIHFEKYVNRIHRIHRFEGDLPEGGKTGREKWRRERDSNPRYTFKGRTIA